MILLPAWELPGCVSSRSPVTPGTPAPLDSALPLTAVRSHQSQQSPFTNHHSTDSSTQATFLNPYVLILPRETLVPLGDRWPLFDGGIAGIFGLGDTRGCHAAYQGGKAHFKEEDYQVPGSEIHAFAKRAKLHFLWLELASCVTLRRWTEFNWQNQWINMGPKIHDCNTCSHTQWPRTRTTHHLSMRLLYSMVWAFHRTHPSDVMVVYTGSCSQWIWYCKFIALPHHCSLAPISINLFPLYYESKILN